MMITHNEEGLAPGRAEVAALASRAEADEARYMRDMARILSNPHYQDRPEQPRLQVVRSNQPKMEAPINQVTDPMSGETMGYFFHASVEQVVRSVLTQLLASTSTMSQLASLRQDVMAIEQKKPSVTPAELGLTERETEVLRIIAQGKSNKEISRLLNIAVGTVKVHTRSVCAKLNVTRRTEAIVAVNRLGLELEAN
jgi:ATP/maltotriose-dependent transcriptional regulator MalT